MGIKKNKQYIFLLNNNNKKLAIDKAIYILIKNKNITYNKKIFILYKKLYKISIINDNIIPDTLNIIIKDNISIKITNIKNIKFSKIPFEKICNINNIFIFNYKNYKTRCENILYKYFYKDITKIIFLYLPYKYNYFIKNIWDNNWYSISKYCNNIISDNFILLYYKYLYLPLIFRYRINTKSLNNITENLIINKQKYINTNLCIINLTLNLNLDLYFLINNYDKLHLDNNNIKYIFIHQKLTLKKIDMLYNKNIYINWKYITINQQLTDNILNKYEKYILWDKIYLNKKISISDLIIKYKHKIKHKYLLYRCNDDNIIKFLKYFTWDEIVSDYIISDKIILQYPNIKEYKNITNFEKISLNIIIKYPYLFNLNNILKYKKLSNNEKSVIKYILMN